MVVKYATNLLLDNESMKIWIKNANKYEQCNKAIYK